MRVLLLLLVCLLAACGDKACEAFKTGLPRDECIHDRALARPAADLAAFKADASSIQDPVVKTATVLSWVTLHRGEIPFREALDLCQTLPPSEVHICKRRVEAGHLNR